MERHLAKERNALQEQVAALTKTNLARRPDAEAAAEKLRREPRCSYDLDLITEERPCYARGRPTADGTRTVVGSLRERTEVIEAARQETGCFCASHQRAPPRARELPYDSKETLLAYKDQHGVEQNFGLPKDRAIVNAIFLKRPQRIEALGFVFVVSLLLWRLIESQMRRHLAQTQTKLPSWDNKPTDRPTSFMLTTKWKLVLVLNAAGRRLLGHTLSDVQHAFLTALTPAVFTQVNQAQPP